MGAVCKRLISLLLLCCVLCGCSVTTAGVEELLRAPQLSGSNQAVQNALNEYLGQIAQLKYPNQGEFLTPFLFGDWDGDHVEDAAVLFQADNSANVQMALLSKGKEDDWQVLCTVEGLSGAVDSVKLAGIQPISGDQILVGYATAGDKYLAVYNYKDGAVETVLQQPYTQYLIEDITGGGIEDLIVLTDSAEGETSVQLLIGVEDGFTRLPTIGLSSGQFSGCAAVSAGIGSGGGRYLILDGWTGANGNYLASSMFRYDPQNRRMTTAKLNGTLHLYEESLRYSPWLTSRDIDSDGIVEIPVQREENGTLNMTQSKRYAFVRWMDYTSLSPEGSFGLLDEEYGYYLELPAEWEGNLLMTDGPDGTMELYNLSGEQLLMQLQVSAELAGGRWYSIGMVASRHIQICLGEGVTDITINRLQRGMQLL